MDPAQEKQVKRFTATMLAVLRYTANRGSMAKIGRWLRPARVLEARGFIVVDAHWRGCDRVMQVPATGHDGTPAV